MGGLGGVSVNGRIGYRRLPDGEYNCEYSCLYKRVGVVLIFLEHFWVVSCFFLLLVEGIDRTKKEIQKSELSLV